MSLQTHPDSSRERPPDRHSGINRNNGGGDGDGEKNLVSNESARAGSSVPVEGLFSNRSQQSETNDPPAPPLAQAPSPSPPPPPFRDVPDRAASRRMAAIEQPARRERPPVVFQDPAAVAAAGGSAVEDEGRPLLYTPEYPFTSEQTDRKLEMRLVRSERGVCATASKS